MLLKPFFEKINIKNIAAHEKLIYIHFHFEIISF